jgi:hypothetical protein
VDTESVRRPRVARETRLLLGVAVLAVVALWALARLRFPDRSPSQQVVAPILAPLVARQGFAGLEGQLSDATARLGPSMVIVRTAAGPRSGAGVPQVALRLQKEIGVYLAAGDGALAADAGVLPIARDVTGLRVVAVPPGPAAPVAVSWFRRDPLAPRYLLQTSASDAGVSLSPVLVGGLVPEDAALWTGSLWRASTGAGLTSGSFLFTPDGEWIGLAVTRGGRPAIAPAELVVRLAEARLTRTDGAELTLGVDVQAMTPALAGLLAFPNGVAVTRVQADGPAHGILHVGDVVHAADGRPLPTLEHWRRHLADLGARPTNLAVWRDGESRILAVTPGPLVPAPGPAPAVTSRPPGLTLRLVPGQGSVITALPPDSPMAEAALRVGDLITRLGATNAPTPGDVRAALAARGAPGLLVAFTRDGQPALTVIAP